MESTKRKKMFKQLMLSSIVIGISVSVSLLLVFTKPKSKKQAQSETIPSVEAVKVTKVEAPVFVRAQGQMEPAHSLRILAEVSGKVIYSSKQFTEGGVIKSNDVIIRIDPKEYELSLSEKKSTLYNAKLNLALEKAKRQVAMIEFERRNNSQKVSAEAKALATRAHYFDKAQSEYRAALAAVERAQLALEKTTIRSPINAMIHKTNVSVGEYIFAQKEVATIYGTDEFKAVVNIPINDLIHIKLCEGDELNGSKATISQISMNNTAIERDGVVSKLLPQLGPLGHMARVMIVVRDPLGIGGDDKKALPLLAGARVSVLIKGKKIRNVYAVPRSALTHDDSIMIVGKDSTLSLIKPVIIRRDRDFIYAANHELEHQLVVINKDDATKVGHKVKLLSASSRGIP